VLFQLPPNFKKDLARLDGLLTRLPAGLRCALEFRHESWLAEDVYERLRTANAALCLADTEEETTPLQATADWGYLRLRDQGYTAADLEEWARTITRLGAGWQDVFVYFKHEEAGTGPEFARQLNAILNPSVLTPSPLTTSPLTTSPLTLPSPLSGEGTAGGTDAGDRAGTSPCPFAAHSPPSGAVAMEIWSIATPVVLCKFPWRHIPSARARSPSAWSRSRSGCTPPPPREA
jgi:hypothetical protein